MPIVPVAASNGSYEVRIERGLLSRVGARLSAITRSPQAIVLMDATVADHHGPAMQVSLNSAFPVLIRSSIPSGESHKTLATVERLYGELLNQKVSRNTPLIAFGGGVVGDIAGFVAATLLRGVPFVQVPTTLLAMVDASVGGKTGVDHPCGKNLIGAFHQPIAVFIDPEVLGTLPQRELRNGLAECMKHEIIRDAQGFASLEQNLERALALDMNYLTDLIAHNVAIKAKVVAADPLERGERAHLNFGHTFGHAIESVSKFQYSHGESVALGMCAASRLAVDLKMLDAASQARIVALIDRAGLPIGGMKLDLDKVIDAMAFDKKSAGGKLRFILPDRIGHVVIRDDVPDNLTRAALASLQE